jgi:hypothetical protein
VACNSRQENLAPGNPCLYMYVRLERTGKLSASPSRSSCSSTATSPSYRKVFWNSILGAMVSSDLFQVAQVALRIVSQIATQIGIGKRQPLCGRLGCELFMLAKSLETLSPDQEDSLRPRIGKLLKDIERICTVSD